MCSAAHSRSQLVFGIHAVLSALRNDPEHVEGIWIDRARRDARMRELIALAERRNVKVHLESSTDLARRVPGRRHQGVVAQYREAAPVTEGRLEELLAQPGPALVLVLDGVTDPHNLGACLRSAEAAGVRAVIAPKDRAAGLTPTVRKVASGAAERVPFVAATNLARALRNLRDTGVTAIGAVENADASLYDTDLTGPAALVLGAEGKGLRRLTRESCDRLVSLPMAGQVESLNVSVAAGVCLFEAVRQRRAQ